MTKAEAGERSTSRSLAPDQLPARFATWRTWIKTTDTLKLLAGGVAAAGLTLHLIGTVWQDSYLRSWGLDAAAFPKTTDRLIIQGYEAVVGLSLKLLPSTLANFFYIVVAALVVSLYWSLIGWQKVPEAKELPAWFLRLPGWMQTGLTRFFVVLAITALVIMVVVAASIFLALPVMVGEITAKKHAEDEATLFVKGCAAAKETQCFDLKRGNEVSRGFLIDSSPEHIAFFDVTLNRARVIPRTGTEILGIAFPTTLTQSSAGAPSGKAASVSISASGPPFR